MTLSKGQRARVLIAAFSIVVLAGSTAAAEGMAASSSGPASVPLAGSLRAPGTARLIAGHAGNAPMVVSLVLAPRGAASLDQVVADLYDPSSPHYRQWLAKGEFARRYAPSASNVTAARRFLSGAGLRPAHSPSPFVLRAMGTTAQVAAAFRTSIADYRAADGTTFFQNTTAARIPSALAGRVIAVGGLTNTVRFHPDNIPTAQAARQAGTTIPRYGAAPGGSGLTPSQLTGIYAATGVHALGARGKGKGATLAVFELSGYTRTDVVRYEQQFFGSAERVAIQNVKVDGGPANPVCPTGDSCGPFGPAPCEDGCNSADFSGDIEVEADIETQIALAPAIDKILVYNAPNDVTGLTSVDEFFRIANDNLADSISISWGLCEPDDTLGVAEAEFVAFAQMAAQGQSVFASSGDSGAFDCLGDPAHPGLNVDDPTSQPFVTSVGGTSFGTYDPGINHHPSYPIGSETVWNPLDLCSGTESGLGACAQFGATGGGFSRFWPRPAFQHGPGVTSALSRTGPKCSQAAPGQFCRQVPDVSANADEFTPYAEFCLGANTTTGAGASTCASFAGSQVPPGWFGIGGTSLSSPVWSAIIALSDSVHGARFGLASAGLYRLFRQPAAHTHFFHDMTGVNQTENNNGFYPTTAAYDMATGIGTPKITAIAEATP